MDSNDRERVSEAREERESQSSASKQNTWTDGIFSASLVQRMLSEDELKDALLLVFANKQVSTAQYYSYNRM